MGNIYMYSTTNHLKISDKYLRNQIIEAGFGVGAATTIYHQCTYKTFYAEFATCPWDLKANSLNIVRIHGQDNIMASSL